MKNKDIVRKILDLHIKHFIPLQYTESQLKKGEIEPCIRIHADNDGIYADVIVWTGDGHDFMDGNYYDDCDGIGGGDTVREALSDLLHKTELAIRTVV